MAYESEPINIRAKLITQPRGRMLLIARPQRQIPIAGEQAFGRDLLAITT